VPPRVGDGARIRLQLSTPHTALVRVDVLVTIAEGADPTSTR
jgi:hypothetical protein